MMGFFKKSSVERDIPALTKKKVGCGLCGLSSKCCSPKMPVIGKGRKGILIIGEAPGEREDRRGVQMIGASGHFLIQSLRALGIDFEEDCWKTNALRCHKKGEVRGQEIDCCRPHLIKTIEELKPKVILALGGAAMLSLIKDSKLVGEDSTSIEKWRGWKIPDQEHKAWICPMYHPAYVLRMNDSPIPEIMFKKDLKEALSMTKTPFPFREDDGNRVEIVRSVRDACLLLQDINKLAPKYLAFDYETSGLKPHAPGHFIRCASVCYSKDWAYSFLTEHDRVKNALAEVLKNDKIGKMAHNIKLEDSWSFFILGVDIGNWAWDSMVQTHVLDNRPNICSLKFQTYVRYGIRDWGKDLGNLLEAENPNDFNRIKEIEEDTLLLYNGKDSLYEYWTAIDQMKELRRM